MIVSSERIFRYLDIRCFQPVIINKCSFYSIKNHSNNYCNIWNKYSTSTTADNCTTDDWTAHFFVGLNLWNTHTIKSDRQDTGSRIAVSFYFCTHFRCLQWLLWKTFVYQMWSLAPTHLLWGFGPISHVIGFRKLDLSQLDCNCSEITVKVIIVYMWNRWGIRLLSVNSSSVNGLLWAFLTVNHHCS